MNNQVSGMNRRFEAIDAFRGICALAVVVFHMNLTGSVTELMFFRGSSIFVDFFFVLSGFVLTHSYAFREKHDFRSFLMARFFRLYPLHLFMLVVFILLEIGKLLAYKYGGFIFNQAPFTGSTAISEIIPNLLLIHAWTPYTEHLTFNYPSWSISIEFYLYAIFFVTIMALTTRYILVWILSSSVAFFLIYQQSDVLVMPVLRGVACFFGGAVVYVIYKKSADLKFPFLLATATEFLSLIFIAMAVQSTFEYRSLTCSIAFLFAIWFFAFEAGLLSRYFKKTVFQYIGKLSYSIYMTHAAILFCLISITMAAQKFTGMELTLFQDGVRFLDFGMIYVNNLVVLATLVLVVYISSLTYKYVEVSGQKLNKKWVQNHR